MSLDFFFLSERSQNIKGKDTNTELLLIFVILFSIPAQEYPEKI
jgi:hypothetical protein